MNSVLEVLEKGSKAITDRFGWNTIVDSIAEAFRFTLDEKERLRNHKLAKLIAALPFLAGCKDPLRTAGCHLGTYILSIRVKDPCNARPSDDEYLLRRLELIGNFIGGDKEIIQRGMNLIALCMISDYARDVEEDKMLGKYNPVSAGVLDYEKEKERLIREIESVPCPDMDKIFSAMAGVKTFWLL
jgi:hypothetical protein